MTPVLKSKAQATKDNYARRGAAFVAWLQNSYSFEDSFISFVGNFFMDQCRDSTLGCTGKIDLCIVEILNNVVRRGRVGIWTKLGSKFIEIVRVTHRTYNIPRNKHTNMKHDEQPIITILSMLHDALLSIIMTA